MFSCRWCARKHTDWRKTYRAALAFALWGDPTFSIPLGSRRPRIAPVTWTAGDGTLSLSIPRRALPAIAVGPYHVRPPPRAMFGGLLLRDGDDGGRRLKELFFTVQAADSSATACSAGPGWDVVSLYAPRTGTMTVLARPDWKVIGGPPAGVTFSFPIVDDPDACGAPKESAA